MKPVLGAVAAVLAVLIALLALRAGENMVAASAVFALIAGAKLLAQLLRTWMNESAAAALAKSRAAARLNQTLRSFRLARLAYWRADENTRSSVDGLAQAASLLVSEGRGAEALRVLDGVGGEFIAPSSTLADAYFLTGHAQAALFVAHKDALATRNTHSGHRVISSLLALGRIEEAEAFLRQVGEAGVCADALSELEAARTQGIGPTPKLARATLPPGDTFAIGDANLLPRMSLLAMWVAATCAPSLLFTLIRAEVLWVANTPAEGVAALAFGLVGGAVLGAIQWLVVRSFCVDSVHWIIATAVGYALGTFAECYVLAGDHSSLSDGFFGAHLFFSSLKFVLPAIFQSVLLTRWRPDAFFWVYATTVGALGAELALGHALPLGSNPAFTTTVREGLGRLLGSTAAAGLGAAMMQWFILERVGRQIDSRHHARRKQSSYHKGFIAASEVPARMPVVALRNTVLYPGGVVSMNFGERAARAAVSSMKAGHDLVLVVPQIRETGDVNADLFRVGTVARLISYKATPDDPGETAALAAVQGLARASIDGFEEETEHSIALIRVRPEPREQAANVAQQTVDALIGRINCAIRTRAGIVQILHTMDDPVQLIDLLVANLSESLDEKRALLDATSWQDRVTVLRQVVERLEKEIQSLRVVPDDPVLRN